MGASELLKREGDNFFWKLSVLKASYYIMNEAINLMNVLVKTVGKSKERCAHQNDVAIL